MKIAFIGQKSIILGAKGGGIETHVAELSRRLAAKGHDVTVYARRRYSDHHPRFVDGVRVRYVPTVYRKNWEAIVHTFLCTIDVLFRSVDVIHYHAVGPALLCWIPRLLRPRATVVVTFHAQDRFHQKWSRFARIVLHAGEWVTCHVPHATIAVSHGLQVVCRNHYCTEAIFIPNGADIKTVSSTGEIAKLGLKRDGYVLTVGRLLRVKGIHHLIKAFRAVKTDQRLVIVGSAALNNRYVEELHTLAKGDARIQFVGFQTGDALAELYAHASLYVQPSESEGLPLTVLEAMSYGTAVLVSDIPGNLEAIHRAGFTFANKDVEDLTAQLQHLIDHPAEVHAAAADLRRVIDRHFSWDRIVARTEEVYISARH